MSKFDLSKITGNDPPLETECQECLDKAARIEELEAETEYTRCCEDCERAWFYIDNEDECPWCKVDTQAARIAELEAIVDPIPETADGVKCRLGLPVFIVRKHAEWGQEHGYGRGPLNPRYEVLEAVVCNIGCLGEHERRAGFIEHGSSFTFSARLCAVYSTRAAAESAKEGAGT